jgi:signal transduction histidine kinase
VVSVPEPSGEAERLAAARRYDVERLARSPALDTLTELVGFVLHAPLSMLTLIGAHQQLVVSAFGDEVARARADDGRVSASPGALALCNLAVQSEDLLVVPDVKVDPRFAQQASIRADPSLRFFAGAPLITAGGHRIGTLCAIDQRPRQLSSGQMTVLSSLAKLAQDQLELHHLSWRLQEELAERHRLERIKDDFISTVNHELRTPLTSIRGALGLLAGGAAGLIPDKARELVGIAKRNSERLSVLISDILDVETMEAGSFKLTRERISAQELIQLAIESARSPARQRSIAFSLTQPCVPLLLEADKTRLVQALGNLISNAIKFSPPGEVVQLTARAVDKMARFEIEDSGPGIPAEFQSRVFERFARADASDSRAAGGTGLGLSIAKTIVERHGGDIHFQSPARDGHGARFWFDIPRAGDPPPSTVDTAEIVTLR